MRFYLTVEYELNRPASCEEIHMYNNLQSAINEFGEKGVVELINWAIERKAAQRVQSKKYQARVKEAMRYFHAAQANPNGPLGTRVTMS